MSINHEFGVKGPFSACPGSNARFDNHDNLEQRTTICVAPGRERLDVHNLS